MDCGKGWHEWDDVDVDADALLEAIAAPPPSPSEVLGAPVYGGGIIGGGGKSNLATPPSPLTTSIVVL